MFDQVDGIENLPLKERELVNVMSQHSIGCLVGHLVTHAVAGGFNGVVSHGATKEYAWETTQAALGHLIQEAFAELEQPFNEEVDKYLAAMDTEAFEAAIQSDIDAIEVVTDAEWRDALDVLDDANLLDTPPEITLPFPDGPIGA